MFKYYKIFTILFFILLSACSKDVSEISVLKDQDIEKEMIDAYEEGFKALEGGDVIFAAKKFNEAELLFPQSEWAPKSALMAAYSYYTQDYYGDAIAELERFLKIYPKYKNLDYAYYLLSISYYEQIVDEKKDLQSIINAKKYFNIVVKNFPSVLRPVGPDPILSIGFLKPISTYSTEVFDTAFKYLFAKLDEKSQLL